MTGAGGFGGYAPFKMGMVQRVDLSEYLPGARELIDQVLDGLSPKQVVESYLEGSGNLSVTIYYASEFQGKIRKREGVFDSIYKTPHGASINYTPRGNRNPRDLNQSEWAIVAGWGRPDPEDSGSDKGFTYGVGRQDPVEFAKQHGLHVLASYDGHTLHNPVNLPLAQMNESLLESKGTIKITREGDHYVVFTPYNPDAAHAWRQDVAGRRYDPDRKANLVPVKYRKHLDTILRDYYQGYDIQWPQGDSGGPQGHTPTKDDLRRFILRDVLRSWGGSYVRVSDLVNNVGGHSDLKPFSPHDIQATIDDLVHQGHLVHDPEDKNFVIAKKNLREGIKAEDLSVPVTDNTKELYLSTEDFEALCHAVEGVAKDLPALQFKGAEGSVWVRSEAMGDLQHLVRELREQGLTFTVDEVRRTRGAQ